MGALTGLEGAKRANAAAEMNRNSALDAYGLNAAARQQEREIMTTQTHTALMNQRTKDMYSSQKILGTQRSIAAAAGAGSDPRVVSGIKSVLDFEGQVSGQNIKNQLLKMDTGFMTSKLEGHQRLRGQLIQAKGMERSESNALISGLFQDVGMVVGMASGVASGGNALGAWGN